MINGFSAVIDINSSPVNNTIKTNGKILFYIEKKILTKITNLPGWWDILEKLQKLLYYIVVFITIKVKPVYVILFMIFRVSSTIRVNIVL